MEKIGIIDVGGGLRGIYAAGVFDWCMENGVQFDYGIGISAGSANLASYLSGQHGRNYAFYEEYSMRKQYMGAGNMLHGGTFLNLQYIYGTLSNAGGENPLGIEPGAQLQSPDVHRDKLFHPQSLLAGRAFYLLKLRHRQISLNSPPTASK